MLFQESQCLVTRQNTADHISIEEIRHLQVDLYWERVTFSRLTGKFALPLF